MSCLKNSLIYITDYNSVTDTHMHAHTATMKRTFDPGLCYGEYLPHWKRSTTACKEEPPVLTCKLPPVAPPTDNDVLDLHTEDFARPRTPDPMDLLSPEQRLLAAYLDYNHEDIHVPMSTSTTQQDHTMHDVDTERPLTPDPMSVLPDAQASLARFLDSGLATAPTPHVSLLANSTSIMALPTPPTFMRQDVCTGPSVPLMNTIHNHAGVLSEEGGVHAWMQVIKSKMST